MSYCRSNFVKTALVAVSALVISVPALATDYEVEINKTSIVRLSRPAAAVIIGNPKIADISVHSSDTLLLSGRGFGSTNILAFDEFGQTIVDAEIQVNAPKTSSAIRVNYIGDGYKTFNCNPNCMPSPILGDSKTFVEQFEGASVAPANATASGPTQSPSQSAQSFAPPNPELQR